MTPQERQLLADLFERVRATAAGSRDPEAEAFINEAVRAQPYAPYVLAQTTLVQQHALEAAAQRIAELESRTAAQAARPEETSFLGNLSKTLFGGASPAPAPSAGYDASAYRRTAQAPSPAAAPPPAYAPPQQPGPWGAAPAAPAGGGFLASAMTTAAGVAGGMVLANTLESLIGGRGGLFGGHSAGLYGGGETVNNFYESAPDPAGQRADDVAQNSDLNANDAQEVGYDDGGLDAGGFDDGSFDT